MLYDITPCMYEPKPECPCRSEKDLCSKCKAEAIKYWNIMATKIEWGM